MGMAVIQGDTAPVFASEWQSPGRTGGELAGWWVLLELGVCRLLCSGDGTQMGEGAGVKGMDRDPIQSSGRAGSLQTPGTISRGKPGEGPMNDSQMVICPRRGNLVLPEWRKSAPNEAPLSCVSLCDSG